MSGSNYGGRRSHMAGASYGNPRRLNVAMLLISLVAGAIAWGICVPVYSSLSAYLPRPVVIAACFGVLALVVSLAIGLCSLLMGTLKDNVFLSQGGGGSAVPALLLGVLAVLMLLAGVFQWVYSLRVVTQSAATSYVFVIDDSGSMSTNDPAGLRYSAIDEVLEPMSPDFPYMVYAFADEVALWRDMSPASQGNALAVSEVGGGTRILLTLNQILQDHTQGLWAGGASPKVVFLTDGEDYISSSDLEQVLQGYRDRGITISTVGLGRVDRSLLSRIANFTGGVFVDIRDASELSGAMRNAATMTSTDDLLTSRYAGRNGALYGILRVVLLTLLGTIVGLARAVAYGHGGSAKSTVLASIAQSFAGGLIVEIGNLLNAPEMVMWLLLWLLLSLTICHWPDENTSHGDQFGNVIAE